MKLCPYPFSRLQANNTEGKGERLKESFYPCCPSWFTQEYEAIPGEDHISEIWNGKAAVELRKRMYAGDFSLCDRKLCQMPLLTPDEMQDPAINFLETPISQENLEAIRRQDPIMPAAPSSLHLSADQTCNLSCSICRPKVILNAKPTSSAQDEYEYVQKTREHLEVVKMASGGEVFYSTLQRQLLKNFNSNDFPKLRRVHIVSNGTLFNQKTYNDLQPGTSFIKDVSISLDAGSKEVYEKVRGPYWDQIYSNLIWISSMRRAGKFDFFSINFVLQKANFRDIPNLVRLGKELGVDRILIQRYLAIPGLDEKVYAENSVHLESHPDHSEMMKILESYKNEPKLYTLLEIPGFADRIETDVDVRKALKLHHEAISHMETRRMEDALASIDESLILHPTFHSFNLKGRILVELALVEVSKDRIPEAQRIVEEARMVEVRDEDVPSSVSSWIKTRAFEAQGSDDYSLSLKIFDLLRNSLDEVDAHVAYARGECYQNLGQPSQAKIHYSKAVELEPQHFHALMALGNIEKSEMNLEASTRYFKQALDAASPEETKLAKASIYFCLMDAGFASKAHGQPVDAIACFDEAEVFEPEDSKGVARSHSSETKYFMNLGLSFKAKDEGQYEEALSYLQSTLSIEPKNQLGDARRYMEEIRSLQVKQTYFSKRDQSYLAKEAGAFVVAMELLKEIIPLEPEVCRGEAQKFFDELQYLYLREQCFTLQKKQNYKEALALGLDALRFGTDGDLLFSIGVCQKRLKDYAHAEKKFREAIRLSPSHYWALLELGFLKLRTNEREAALELFFRAQDVEPKDRQGHTIKYILISLRDKCLTDHHEIEKLSEAMEPRKKFYFLCACALNTGLKESSK